MDRPYHATAGREISRPSFLASASIAARVISGRHTHHHIAQFDIGILLLRGQKRFGARRRFAGPGIGKVLVDQPDGCGRIGEECRHLGFQFAAIRATDIEKLDDGHAAPGIAGDGVVFGDQGILCGQDCPA